MLIYKTYVVIVHYNLKVVLLARLQMIYQIQTLETLKLFIRAFRKQKGVTQADMAQKLGISQQAYARFEGNPQLATLERLFLVLRILDVKISLEQIIKNSKEAKTNMKSESKEIW
ncbi:helix-turn-helix domain-containing protein [Polynucleobacter sp. Fuers-14]|jgi:HTH-type transcriptional regulator / antitoxin HipB|uniref:helix-turn-helix domain-containing protein n=2 Tax=unclassified Polynucleobacter TaxID=2640945 RepID=UPI001C0C948D|nr:helix-turn-helix transcriptional regulator [Polynucleobacter sp. Fuers-14]MBU3640570.1 helix-turn-helix transcriptional regulator [Polynucleobacter sp. Fuers-14]